MKQIKIQGTFEVFEPDTKTCEGKHVMNDAQSYDCVTTLHPVKVPGNSVNFPISFGGVALAKRIFIRTSQEVTVKMNVITEAGFLLKGFMVLTNDNGVTALFVDTGPTETEIVAVIAGDSA